MKQLEGEFSRDKGVLVSEGGIRFPHHMYLELSDIIAEAFDIPGVNLIAIANKLDVMMSNNPCYNSMDSIVDMSEVYEIGLHRDDIERTMDRRSSAWKKLW